jgi:hypothetical protein
MFGFTLRNKNKGKSKGKGTQRLPRNNITKNFENSLNILKRTKYEINTFTNFVNYSKRTCDLKSPNRLPDETFMEGLKRSISFLYQKMKGLPISKKMRHISPEQKEELRKSIRDILANIPEKSDRFSILAQRLFHTDIRKLDAELKAFEDYSLDKIIDKGTTRAKCSLSVSSYLHRLVPLILHTDKEQQYLADYSDYVCSSFPTPEPLKSLDEEKCVAVARSKKELSSLENELGTKFGAFIVVKPQFFVPDSTSGVIFLKANRLLAISFIIDALANKGIITTNLQKLLRN